MANRNNIWANLDWLTIFLYLLLVFLGWINIYAAVYNEEHSSILDMSQRYGKQLIWIIAAFILAAALVIIDSRVYVSFAYVFYGLIILLLIGVLLFGQEIKDHVRGSRSAVLPSSRPSSPNSPPHWPWLNLPVPTTSN